MADNYTARQDGQWQVVSTTPDVCKTPMGPSTPPVPYPVTANMGTAVMVVPSVKLNGCPAVVCDQSIIPQTTGDAAGVAKGVSSGTVGDVCEPLAHSETVFFGGRPMLRHNDAFWMNSRNTVGLIVGQPPPTGVPADDADPPDEPETKEEESQGDWLDWVQTGLDIAGFIPVFGGPGECRYQCGAGRLCRGGVIPLCRGAGDRRCGSGRKAGGKGGKNRRQAGGERGCGGRAENGEETEGRNS